MRITFTDNSRQVIRDMESIAKNALRDTSLYVEGKAKLLSPVDTGDLRGSISHKFKNDKEVHIGTDVEYAVFVEKGTSRQSAQPFLTPSVENNIREIKKIFESHLKRVGDR